MIHGIVSDKKCMAIVKPTQLLATQYEERLEGKGTVGSKLITPPRDNRHQAN
jgi:hypothetical protein